MAKRSRQDSVSSPSDATSLYTEEGATSKPCTPASSDDLPHPVKYTHLDEGSASSDRRAVMKCSLPPHQPLSFPSYEEYEVHYQKTHVNHCSTCHKDFPSDHYLGLHIAENHDPLNEARKARGEKTYGCFVEDCDRVCSTPQKRRMHVIDKHQFPKYYDFYIVNDGLDKRNSMLRPGLGHRRRSSAATNAAQTDHYTRQQANSNVINASARKSLPLPQGNESSIKVSSTSAASQDTESGNVKPVREEGQTADEMENITKSMSALKFVPPSIRFGRGKGRGGLARR